MNTEFFAYMAGLFDGEGYVGVNRNSLNGRLGLKIVIANTVRDPLDEARAHWGGCFTRKPYRMRGSHWKDSWGWEITGSAAYGFLTDILPYLRIKKAQADCALQFPIGKKRKPVTAEMQAQREAVRDELIALKKHFTPVTSVQPDRKGARERPAFTEGVALYEAGESQEAAGKALGISRTTVRNYALGAGVPLRTHEEARTLAGKTRRSRTHDRPEVIQAMDRYAQGESVQSIAAALGLKAATVNYWLRMAGVTRSYAEAQQLRRASEKAVAFC